MRHESHLPNPSALRYHCNRFTISLHGEDHVITLELSEIRLVERAHYYMQLSAYFSELVDLPGLRFAFTNRFEDTWYNQAYDIDWEGRDPVELGRLIHNVCSSRDRAPCVYTSPANLPSGMESTVEDLGFVKFEEESWMFLSLDATEPSLGSNRTDITISEVTPDRDFSQFAHVYRNGLPGPDVESYIDAVRDGLRYAPPGVDVCYLLAFIDGEPVGMLSVLSTQKCSGIYAVATLDPFRRRGVASALVNRAAQVARRNDSKYFFLQTVTGDEGEQAFGRIGFHVAFTRFGYTTPEILESMTHG